MNEVGGELGERGSKLQLRKVRCRARHRRAALAPWCHVFCSHLASVRERRRGASPVAFVVLGRGVELLGAERGGGRGRAAGLEGSGWGPISGGQCGGVGGENEYDVTEGGSWEREKTGWDVMWERRGPPN